MTVRVEGDLKHGLRIGEKLHTHFAVGAADTGDLFDAEEQIPASRPLAYRAALLTRQLEYIGDYRGPFTLDMLRKLHPVDFGLLVDAQVSVDEQGEIAVKK